MNTLFAFGLLLFLVMAPWHQTTANDVFGFHITEGAAAGYVADKACATCHNDKYQSYQSVGMAKSFTKPRPEKYIENFDLPPLYHAKSQRYYRIIRRGDDIFFHRYQLDHQNQPINVFERQIDWILGSGHKTRSYLYQNDLGEIYQLPLGWYNETQEWQLAPGYDKKHHLGIGRNVRRECMFCHNAFPEVEAGSDRRNQAHRFPHELPEGTGCQRCHGPGAGHIQTVTSGEADLEAIHNSIVNPRKLPVAERDSVCFQCHMLPAIALIGTRRLDRPVYSYRPGENISDYLVHIDVEEEGLSQDNRFEINHHAYRLYRSQCFQQSEGALSCISCHDPHHKVAESDVASTFSAVCKNCHDQQHPKTNTETNTETNTKELSDCISCHMPQRRTQDVVHIVMTDHKIQRFTPNKETRLAPLHEREHDLTALEILDLPGKPEGDEALLYQLLALIRALPTHSVANKLEQHLSKMQPVSSESYFDLAKAWLDLKHYTKAESLLLKLTSQHPDNAQAWQWLGIAYTAQQKSEQAVEAHASALRIDPQLPEAHFNLALTYFQQQQYNLARTHLEHATSHRPTLAKAWYYLGVLAAKKDDHPLAIWHFQKALALEPTLTRGYNSIATSYQAINQTEQANRYLMHGKKVAFSPDKINPKYNNGIN